MNINQINFLPLRIIHEQLGRRRRGRHIALIFFLIAVMIGWYVVDHRQLVHLEEYASTLETQVEARQAHFLQEKRLQIRLSALRKELRLQEELQPPVKLSQALATLGQQLPSSICLANLLIVDVVPPQPQSASSSKNNSTAAASKSSVKASNHARSLSSNFQRLQLTVVGWAPDDVPITDFVAAVSQHALFDDVKLLYSKPVEMNDLSVREFRMELQVPFERTIRLGPAPAKGVADAH